MYNKNLDFYNSEKTRKYWNLLLSRKLHWCKSKTNLEKRNCGIAWLFSENIHSYQNNWRTNFTWVVCVYNEKPLQKKKKTNLSKYIEEEEKTFWQIGPPKCFEIYIF